MKNLVFSFLILLSNTTISQTLIKEESFHVTLPINWFLLDQSKQEGLWVYQDPLGNERLTVSIQYFSEEPSFELVRESLESFISIRKSVSADIDSGVSFTSGETKEYKTAITHIFVEHGSNGRKAANKTIATKVGIANFYYESYEASTFFEQKVKSILSTTGFAS